jgi:adenosylmethionine-8-amino-7-oxononanoate aminotransferase
MSLPNDTFSDLWFPFTYQQDIVDYPPIVIAHGKGIHLYDSGGKCYLDGVGSWWLSLLGHGHPEIVAAIKKQLDSIEQVMMAGCIAPPTRDCAHELAAIVPRGLTRVFFSDDGSTAVEAALKIALQYWLYKKQKRAGFVSFAGAYHGDTLGAMSVGMIPEYHTLFHALFCQHHSVDAPYCYRCPVGKCAQSCSAECMDSLERLLNERGDSIAACIFEPMIQGAAGMRIYPAKVLTRVFQLCRKAGVLTIADEVAVGFGRTGKLFGCNHPGETPDIMCVAKGLTGGFIPLAATIVREEIYQEFCGDFMSGRIFHHGHSFTGNPPAAAAACAVLGILRRDNLPYSLNPTMAYFRDRLKSFSEFDIVGDVRSLGMIGAIELVADRKTKKKLPAEKRLVFTVCRKAIEKGLLIRPLGDVIYFVPSLLITKNEIDEMFGILRDALKETIDETLPHS